MKDTADYEESEVIAIASGKQALARAPWLFDRKIQKTKGFFAELSVCPANPDFYDVDCVDGEGTKLYLAPWSGDFRKGRQDGIAMNANDMAPLIHAYPTKLNLYMACQTEVEKKHMGEIMNGIVDALEKIRIPWAPHGLNIGKLETASLDEMISLGVQNKGFDLGVIMSGLIPKNKVPNLDPKPRDVIVGVTSTGLHSNGYTGARHAILKWSPEVEYREEWKSQYKGKWGLHDKPSILEGKTVLEALQVPTALYLREAAEIGREFDNPNIYGINITGNGLHNFNRAGKNVSFEITDPFEPLPIHRFLTEESGWSPEKSYKKQNMGMGFAYITPSLDIAEGIVQTINNRGENKAKIIGELGYNEGELRTTLHKPYEGKPIDFVGYTN